MAVLYATVCCLYFAPPSDDAPAAAVRFPMMATIDITKLSKDVLDYPDAEASDRR